MENSKNLQQQLDMKIQISNINKSLALVFERLRIEPFDITGMTKDILDEFSGVGENKIIEAIRFGGLGVYGQTYRFSTQVVCIWIRTHIKTPEKKSNEQLQYENIMKQVELSKSSYDIREGKQ